jgi:hypothetical protein
MKVCYICSSSKHVDDHHIDCNYGEVSPDTVPPCRRCHRTYHDLGIEWFDDELQDRAIEVENMRRAISAEPPLEKRDIVRLDYWYKKHGIKREQPFQETSIPLIRPGIEPLCGWPWLEENRDREYPWQGITVLFNEKPLLCLPSTTNKRGYTLIKSTMQMARSVARSRA